MGGGGAPTPQGASYTSRREPTGATLRVTANHDPELCWRALEKDTKTRLSTNHNKDAD